MNFMIDVIIDVWTHSDESFGLHINHEINSFIEIHMSWVFGSSYLYQVMVFRFNITYIKLLYGLIFRIIKMFLFIFL